MKLLGCRVSLRLLPIENRDLSLQEFKSRYSAAVTRRWAVGKELWRPFLESMPGLTTVKPVLGVVSCWSWLEFLTWSRVCHCEPVRRRLAEPKDCYWARFSLPGPVGLQQDTVPSLSRSAPGLCSPGDQPSPAAPQQFNILVGKHNAEKGGNAGEDFPSSC